MAQELRKKYHHHLCSDPVHIDDGDSDEDQGHHTQQIYVFDQSGLQRIGKKVGTHNNVADGSHTSVGGIKPSGSTVWWAFTKRIRQHPYG